VTKQYSKTKECGCVIKAISCGIKNNPDGKMYLLGGHDHLIICDNCKKIEDHNEDDTLHDMWTNDNITNDFGYAEWKLIKKVVFNGFSFSYEEMIIEHIDVYTNIIVLESNNPKFKIGDKIEQIFCFN
jgi:hypothetical protein